MRQFSYGLVIGLFWIGVNPSNGQTPFSPDQLEKQLEKRREDQKKKPAAEPQTLEQMIAEALKNNPDLKVAESKVREAYAERERTRSQVATEVAHAKAEIEAARASFNESKERADRAQILFNKGALSKEDLRSALLMQAKLTAELAFKQARLPYLLGNPAPEDKNRSDLQANNPDWRVADTKLASAEAELNRTRTKVAMEVATLDAEIKAAQATVDGAQVRLERMKHLYEIKSIEEGLYNAAAFDLEKAKAAMSVKQAMLPYLLGKQPLEGTLSEESIVRIWKRDGKRFKPLFMPVTIDLDGAIQAEHVLLFLDNIKSETPLTEKLRKALDAPAAHNGGKFNPTDALNNVQTNMFPGINLLVRAKSLKKEPMEIKLTQPVPAGAYLQYLEDELDIVFVLRDYGIVVVGADEKLPPGAMRVIDFWKLGKAPEPAAKEKSISAGIEKIDPKDRSLVQLSVGANVGIKKGNTYQILRVSAPTYVGTIRIEEVMAQRSVGRAWGPDTVNPPMLREGEEVYLRSTAPAKSAEQK
jgi:multidrug resistance efflux pump